MADIKITLDDLKDPSIDDVLNLQRSVQPQGGQKVEEIKTPFYFNPIFYYTIAASLGVLLAWLIIEPHIKESVDKESTSETLVGAYLTSYLVFGAVAAALGMSVGIVYGLVNRNFKQMLYCGVVGAGVGLGVTLLTTVLGEIIYMIRWRIILSMLEERFRSNQKPNPEEIRDFFRKGAPFFVQMCGRALAWSVIAMGAGLGLGIALKSKKLMLNGFVGGMIGGMLGGMVFDPIERFITPNAENATVSRCIGFLAVGILVGFFTGLFENLSREAWFLMLKGPLSGKQFILFKSPMFCGSSPKSEIYIFKDPDVAPKHASITKTGSKYMLKDEGSDKGTFVNGRKIDKYVLQSNDTITIGEAVFRYVEKMKNS